LNHSQIVSFLWGISDIIRDTFKRGKYQDVILPLTVLRRLDCVLAPTKEQVLETNARLHAKLDNLEPQLRKASGYAFYNTSRYDFDKLLADAPRRPRAGAPVSRPLRGPCAQRLGGWRPGDHPIRASLLLRLAGPHAPAVG
jgi:type I restriction-modification system DNA methylase subunit